MQTRASVTANPGTIFEKTSFVISVLDPHVAPIKPDQVHLNANFLGQLS